jgi:hypothetical protein
MQAVSGKEAITVDTRISDIKNRVTEKMDSKVSSAKETISKKTSSSSQISSSKTSSTQTSTSKTSDVKTSDTKTSTSKATTDTESLKTRIREKVDSKISETLKDKGISSEELSKQKQLNDTKAKLLNDTEIWKDETTDSVDNFENMVNSIKTYNNRVHEEKAALNIREGKDSPDIISSKNAQEVNLRNQRMARRAESRANGVENIDIDTVESVEGREETETRDFGKQSKSDGDTGKQTAEDSKKQAGGADKSSADKTAKASNDQAKPSSENKEKTEQSNKSEQNDDKQETSPDSTPSLFDVKDKPKDTKENTGNSQNNNKQSEKVSDQNKQNDKTPAGQEEARRKEDKDSQEPIKTGVYDKKGQNNEELKAQALGATGQAASAAKENSGNKDKVEAIDPISGDPEASEEQTIFDDAVKGGSKLQTDANTESELENPANNLTGYQQEELPLNQDTIPGDGQQPFITENQDELLYPYPESIEQEIPGEFPVADGYPAEFPVVPIAGLDDEFIKNFVTTVPIENDIDPITGERLDPATGLRVDPGSGRQIDPHTGYHIDQRTGYHFEPESGNYYDPITGEQIDIETGYKIDPTTGNFLNPYTGEQIDPVTGNHINLTFGYQYDPVSGNRVDLDTGYQIDSISGNFINPGTGEQIDPVTGNTIDTPTGKNVDSTTGNLIDPISGHLFDQISGYHVDSSGNPINTVTGNRIDIVSGMDMDDVTDNLIDTYSGRQIDQNTKYHIDSVTDSYINPLTGRTVDPTTGKAIDPATGKPIDHFTGEVIDEVTEEKIKDSLTQKVQQEKQENPEVEKETGQPGEIVVSGTDKGEQANEATAGEPENKSHEVKHEQGQVRTYQRAIDTASYVRDVKVRSDFLEKEINTMEQNLERDLKDNENNPDFEPSRYMLEISQKRMELEKLKLEISSGERSFDAETNSETKIGSLDKETLTYAINQQEEKKEDLNADIDEKNKELVEEETSP